MATARYPGTRTASTALEIRERTQAPPRPQGMLKRLLFAPIRGLLWMAEEVASGYPSATDEARRRSG